jgi:hypothetical protein
MPAGIFRYVWQTTSLPSRYSATFISRESDFRKGQLIPTSDQPSSCSNRLCHPWVSQADARELIQIKVTGFALSESAP